MERATAVAQEQYKGLLTGFQAVGQVKGWKVQQIAFVGGTCGSIHVDSFNRNMKTLGVLESKWDPIRKKLVRRLLEEQDKVLRSYFELFAQKGGTRRKGGTGAIARAGSNANTANASGNGLSNNRIFANSSDCQTAPQNTLIGNAANQYKIGRYVDITNTAGSGVYGATGLMTDAQLNQEFRPYYQLSSNYMYWHDYAVIKFNDLFESLNKIGLVKRFDAQLRLWINTGTININVTGVNTASVAYNLTPADNTFSNTCPDDDVFYLFLQKQKK